MSVEKFAKGLEKKSNIMNFKTKIFKIYPWLFGLLALCLPWQTRYLVSVGIRETATVAIYAFDLILAGILLMSLFWGNKKNWCLAGGWLLAIGLFIMGGMSIEMYWWLRFFEAITWGYLIYQQREAVSKPLWFGFILGMLASGLVGIIQFFTQIVVANKWLGIAEQLPWQAGVSVLETASGRILRAYGAFPHPNIFGGLSAVAIILFLSAKEKLPHWLSLRSVEWLVVTILSVGLLVSFSRNAWLGLILGLAILVFQRKKIIHWAWWILILAVLFNGLWYQFSFGRVSVNNRLEQQSLNERVAALETAFTIARAHPWFGVGLGQFNVAAETLLPLRDPRYIEPVHNVYLLILGEVGIIGALILVLLASWLARRLEVWIYPALSVILFLGLFDHYWWTDTSARLALTLVLALSLKPKQ